MVTRAPLLERNRSAFTSPSTFLSRWVLRAVAVAIRMPRSRQRSSAAPVRGEMVLSLRKSVPSRSRKMMEYTALPPLILRIVS